MAHPVVIDLFAGAGGFGLGFRLAGFDVPFSLEIDEWAASTLRYNHPQMQVLQCDIRDFSSPLQIQKVCSVRPDIVIGGPPCQGFSIAGPAKKDPKDPRNSLFANFAQWVKVLMPKAFVMENVKGLLSRKNSDGEKVLEIIVHTFQELGYFVEIWELNAAEYGVPQVRERIFIVGHRQQLAIGKPLPTHYIKNHQVLETNQLSLFAISLRSAVNLWDAISDLPPLEAGEGQEIQLYKNDPSTDFQNWAREQSSELYNHVAMDHTPRLVERFKHVNWGESGSDVPEALLARRRNGNGEISSQSYDQNNRRLYPFKPSHTIAAAFYANFIHPYQHRNLTAREGARIQSFPDNYRFMGKKTVVSQKLLQREGRHNERHLCQYNQIGNAVPPLLARAIALHLRDTLVL